MNLKTAPILKVSLAIALLICLLDIPYSYYQFVRYIAFMVFVILAFDRNAVGEKKMALVFLLLALIFQPLVKLALGRLIWNVVDVVVAIFLIGSVLVNTKKE